MVLITREHVYAGFDPTTQIRVFKLAVDEKDALVYMLHNVNFKEFSKNYHALSYCWGVKRATVKLNGCDVEVSQNLVDFIRMLWDQFASKLEDWHYLWADAVCIDQNNNEEKAIQVKRMRYIYEEAKHVLAWLGPESETTPLARDLVDKILALHDAREKALGPDKAYQNIDVRGKGFLYTSLEKPCLLEPSISADALYEFLSHDWWSRAWIMQEGTTKAMTSLFWGEELFTRLEMHTIAWYAREIFEELNYQWHTVNGYPERYEVIAMRRVLHRIFLVFIFDRTRSAAMEYRLPTAALLVLEHLRKSDTSDARDKVYAALCLLNKESSDAFVVDYNLPVNEVYTDFARRLIYSTNPPNLDVLGLCVPDESGTSDLTVPSWVPDHTIWSMRSQFHKSLGPGCGPAYFADKCIRDLAALDQRKIHISGDVLHVAGVFVDEITAKSPRSSIKHEFRMSYDWLPEGHQDATYFTNEPMDAVYRSTLVADVGRSDKDKKELHRGYQLDWAALGSKVDESPYRSMIARHAETQSERRLLLTKRGHFGIGPNSLRRGDQLYILLGGQMVYVLRELESFDHYRLVGECYIHGLMDGDFGPIEPHQIRDIKLV